MDLTIADFAPVKMAELEIAAPIEALSAFDSESGSPYKYIKVLVRLHQRPVGMLLSELENGEKDAELLASEVWETFSQEINSHLAEDFLPPLTTLSISGVNSTCQRTLADLQDNAPYVSVIVSTRNRHEQLPRCLDTLLQLSYPNYEIIVVDNAPSSNATQELIRQQYPQIRYVREDWPGLSSARNCGIAYASGEIVAITDDDVLVDPYWLAALVDAFQIDQEVVCVSGLIIAAEIETPAQFLIEECGNLSKGLKRQVYDMHEHRPTNQPLYPYTAGMFGSGANIAFRKSALEESGNFDLLLGTGTPSRGGEDLAIFFDIVTSGKKVVYEPAAIVWHYHRREYEQLRKQMYNYGVGLAAYLTRCLFHKPSYIFDFITKIPGGLYYALSPNSGKNEKKGTEYPNELTRLELLGMLHGPFAYLQARSQKRKLLKRHGLPGVTRSMPLARKI